MTEGRCDLILLGWTAFVGFNFISDILWTGGGSGNHHGRQVVGGPLGNVGGNGVSSSVYRGRYRLLSNGTLLDEGALRISLFSQSTGAMSVQIASLAMELVDKDVYSSLTSTEADLIFSGIELGAAAKLSSTGFSDPQKFPKLGSHSCRLDADINLSRHKLDEDGKTELPDDGRLKSTADGNPEFWSMVGEVVGEECGFTLIFSANAVDVLDATQKVVHYSIWVNILTLLQIRFFLTQMQHTQEGPSAAKVSIICIAIQVLMDAYDSFLHLCLGLSSQYMFNTIAIVSLFKFILFSVVEARYFLTIWRQRRSEAFDQGWEAVRQQLSWLYSRFYGALLMGLVLIYNNLQHLDIIVLAFQAHWVPQILLDAWQGSRSALCPTFIGGISLTRVLSILYLWGCPHTVFNGELYPKLPGAPNMWVCLAAVLLHAVQVGTMVLQRTIGPRWFVPWICMPQVYNYFRNVEVESGSECVICMSDIDIEDARKAVTPCSHAFHGECLSQWMDIKMECPTCRASLPPIH